jgi:YebC/PmpR family DNA-binding regulatory protein
VKLCDRSPGGPGDQANVRLELAIDRAQAQNMPKDNIERAIKRGTGDAKEGFEIEEVTYEGFAPHGIAMLISCVTDNRNRTVAEIRHILNRYGGSMAEAGAVGWQFKRIAYFNFPLGQNNPDLIFELAVEAGADDVTFEDDWVEILAPVEAYNEVNTRLKSGGILPDDAGLKYSPNNELELEDDGNTGSQNYTNRSKIWMMSRIVFSNLSITDSVMAKLEA